MRSVGRFGLVTLSLALMLAMAISWYLALNIILSWLIAINLIAFLTIGYDKAIVVSDRTRVPEKVLLALTFAGGTIGTYLGRVLFHHKTMKAKFITQFRFVVGLQVVLVLVFLLWIMPKL